MLTVKMHSNTLLWESPPAPHRWAQKLPGVSLPGFPAQGLQGRKSMYSEEGDWIRKDSGLMETHVSSQGVRPWKGAELGGQLSNSASNPTEI